MTVYAVQCQMRKDLVQNKLVPKFDMTSAEKFGKIETLLSPSASPFNTQPIVDELVEKLKSYNDDDYLLLIGNPILIGLVVATAADFNDGRVNLLQWSGTKNQYISVRADLFPDTGNY